MFISYSSVVIQCCSKIDLTVFWWYFGPLYKVFAPVKLVFLKKNQTWEIKSEVLSLGELTLVMLWWCKFLPEMPVLRYVLLFPVYYVLVGMVTLVIIFFKDASGKHHYYL